MKTIFELNPGLKEYHKTSDGVKFFTPHDAKNHARTLEDKKVSKVLRPIKGKATNDSQVDTDTTSKTQAGPATNNVKKPNAAQQAKLRKDSISKLETVALVNKALKDETAKSVIEAGKARIVEIKEGEAVKNRIQVILKLETEGDVNDALKGEKSKEVITAGEQRITAIKDANKTIKNLETQE
jgi:hypothetical protein